MAEVLQTNEARQEAARIKLKQHDDAVRANGIKEGRKLERNEILASVGAESVNDFSQLAILRAERDARPTLNEEAKHGWAKFWQGTTLGVALGAALVLAVGSLTLSSAFNQARQYGAGMVAVGAATQAAAPPSTCIPGETLDDGRRCPMTTDQRVGN